MSAPRSANASNMNALLSLDLDWQAERERYLDWGAEPQPPGLPAVVATLLFFLFVWISAVCLRRPEWLCGAAAISIVALYSFRARDFDIAYGEYRRRRFGQARTGLA
jgi:hypothetical protein